MSWDPSRSSDPLPGEQEEAHGGAGFLLRSEYAPTGKRPVIVRRLDSPGRFSSVCLFGVIQYTWQYWYGNLLFFKLAGTPYLYLRPTPLMILEGIPESSVLEHLPCRAWYVPAGGPSPLELYAECFDLQHSGTESPPEKSAAKLARFGPEVDLAPQLHDDLRRAVDSADTLSLASLITLFEILALYRGHGSDELWPPSVRFGEEATSALLQLGVQAEGVRRELLEHAPGAPSSRSQRRVAALTQKRWTHDGTSDGYQEQVALVTLTVSAAAWRYERSVLWSHTRRGIDLS